MKTEIAFVKQGGQILDRNALANFWNAIPDGEWILQLQSRNIRSLKQAGYYWVAVVPAVRQGLQDAGYTEVRLNAQAHELLKQLFLKKEIVSAYTGEMLTTTGSTTELDTQEFENYIDQVVAWAAENLYLSIPPPQRKQ